MLLLLFSISAKKDDNITMQIFSALFSRTICHVNSKKNKFQFCINLCSLPKYNNSAYSKSMN